MSEQTNSEIKEGKHEIDQASIDHLDGLVVEADRRIRSKYLLGVAEHGGHLWEKSGLIDEAINEAIDQVIYLLTLKEQIEQLKTKFGEYQDVVGDEGVGSDKL